MDKADCCRFSLDEDTFIRVHVSADERYKLYLDGQCVGLGSERGDPLHWFYETYDFSLTAGEHVFVAIVWSLGQLAPYSQMSIYHGFFFAPEPPYVELMGTGIADWDERVIDAYTFVMVNDYVQGKNIGDVSLIFRPLMSDLI